MATLRSYAKISRPTVGASSTKLSSYVASLAKKQQSAEDAIIDNQYAAGDISAETYQAELSKRLGRDTITPLQQVQLTKQIGDVRSKLQDTETQRQYAAGEITTEQMRDYEANKLKTMNDPNNPAYKSQQQKVQSLTDKAEKEARATYRSQEQLRISQLPEDSSNTLAQKAKLYANLEAQARTDGDAQAADAFATSKNNYQSAADRATRSDVINQARLSVSQTPTLGRGTPSSTGGAADFRTGSSVTNASQPGARATGTVGVRPSGSVASPGGTAQGQQQVSPQDTQPWLKYVKVSGSAGRSLDSAAKSIDRLHGQQADNATLQQAYMQAYNAAPEGSDEKQRLLTEYNNLVDAGKGISNSLDTTMTNVGLIQDRAQEQQKNAVKTAVGKWKSAEERNLNLDESDLENKLRNAQISKDEYIKQKYALQRGKLAFADQVEQAYGSVDEADTGTTYRTNVYDQLDKSPARQLIFGNGADKLQDPKQIQQHLQQFGQQYELVRDDNSGETGLKPFAQIRRDNKFSGSYIRDKNGVLALVHDAGDLDPATGLPTSKGQSRTNVLAGATKPYFIGADGKPHAAIPLVTKDEKGNLNKVEFHTEEFMNDPKNKNLFQKAITMPGGGKLTGNAPVYEFKPKVKTDPNLFQQAASAVGGFVNNLLKPNQTKLPAVTKQDASQLMNPLQKGGRIPASPTIPGLQFLNPSPQGKQAQGGGLFAGVGGFVGNAINAASKAAKQFSGNIVPQAYASEGGKGNSGASTANLKGVPADTLNNVTQALKDQGIYTPNTLAYALSTLQHETAGSFKPVNEAYYLDQARGLEPGTSGRQEAIRRGYQGGSEYFGRGYIQLTGLGNYKRYGDALGIDLVNNPDLANDPKVAAQIMAMYMKQRGTAALADAGKFVAARGTVNAGDKNAQLVANDAQKYLQQLKTGKTLPNQTQQAIARNMPAKLPTPTPIRLADEIRAQNAKQAQSRTQSSLGFQFPQIKLPNLGNLFGQPAKKTTSPLPGGAMPTPAPRKTVVPGVNDANKNGKIDFNESVLGKGIASAANNVSNAIRNVVSPQAPKVTSPLPSRPSAPAPVRAAAPAPVKVAAPAPVKIAAPAPKPVVKAPVANPVQNVVNTVQKAAAPIVQNIKTGANTVASFISNLFKKK